MWINIIVNADHRVTPARIQAFRAGTSANVPKKTAEALIARGVATPADTSKED